MKNKLTTSFVKEILGIVKELRSNIDKDKDIDNKSRNKNVLDDKVINIIETNQINYKLKEICNDKSYNLNRFIRINKISYAFDNVKVIDNIVTNLLG